MEKFLFFIVVVIIISCYVWGAESVGVWLAEHVEHFFGACWRFISTFASTVWN